MSRVDVVVVCWNDKEKIALALDSVFALPETIADPTFARVVVSDNGSTDGSREYLRERYGHRVTILENGANLGFAAACNRAFVATDSPYVYLLNPDAEFVFRRPRSHRRIHGRTSAGGYRGSRIYNRDGSIQESCGVFDTWAGAFLRSSAWGEWPIFRRYANGAELRAWRHESERRVDLAVGAALCIRRTLLETIGGFDERYFLYHEEVDFAKRAAAIGAESWYVPSSEAVHEGMGSARGLYSVEARKQASRRKYWIEHHGRAWYYALVAALVGRYVAYALSLVGVVVVVRRAFAGR